MVLSSCGRWHYRLKELGAFDTTLPGEAGVSCACLRSTHTLLVGYEHGAVQLWRLPEAPTAELEGGGEPTQEILEMRWNLQPALCLGSLEPHSGRVHSLTTSKDGRLLLSASADHTVTLWSLCDFTPTRTFVFSKAPSHAIPLEPEDFAFVAAVGDSLERVPLTEQMLPLAADRSAMDAAQLLMTREALRNAPKRQDAVEKIQGVSAKARKEEERARKAAKRGAPRPVRAATSARSTATRSFGNRSISRLSCAWAQTLAAAAARTARTTTRTTRAAAEEGRPRPNASAPRRRRRWTSSFG